jgi:hypothetical protein
MAGHNQMANAVDDFFKEFGIAQPKARKTAGETPLQKFFKKMDEECRFACSLRDQDERAWEDFKNRKTRRWFKFYGDELWSKLGHYPLDIRGKKEFGPITKRQSEREVDWDALFNFYEKAKAMIVQDKGLQSQIAELDMAASERTSKPRNRGGKPIALGYDGGSEAEPEMAVESTEEE